MIKLIVPLSLLPDGYNCYKITGEKEYLVKRKITIDSQVIECDESSVFLVSGGYIKSYSSDTEVKYIASDLLEVENLYDEEDYN